MRRAGSLVVAVVTVLAAGCGEAEPVAVDPGAAATTVGAAPAAPQQAVESQPRRDAGRASPRPERTPTASGGRADLADAAEAAARATPEAAPARPVLGADISWPQCPRGMGIPERRTLGMPMPLPEADYVVIGLTNGPAFTPNPCLADQVAWVRERRLMAAAYAVTSYPEPAEVERHRTDGPFDGSTRLGALRNTGYQQARYNIATMTTAGLQSPIVWIDVEPVVDFEWSDDLVANAAVVEGVARGFTDAGYRIGVYSTPYMWAEIVGGFALGVPEWRAAGPTSRQEAVRRCGDDWTIQGGEALMGQWVAASRDQNVTCPGVRLEPGRWFHQY